MSEQTNTDLRAAIMQDHEQVKALFEQCLGGGAGASEAWDTLIRVLAVHETAEEEVLHPTIRSLGDKAEQAVKARLAEEDTAKKELSELEAMGFDAPEFRDRLATFRDAVVDHAEHEEQDVLPFLDEVEPDRRELLAKAFAAAKAVAPTHPHPHAPESAIGNIVTGPAIALMDRARDAVKAVMDKTKG